MYVNRELWLRRSGTVLALNGVHLALNTEVVSDAGDVVVEAVVVLDIDREAVFRAFPFGLSLFDSRVGRRRYHLAISIDDLRCSDGESVFFRDVDRVVVRRTLDFLRFGAVT